MPENHDYSSERQELEALCLKLGAMTRKSRPAFALASYCQAAACRIEAAQGEADVTDILSDIHQVQQRASVTSAPLTTASFGILDQPEGCGEYASICMSVLWVVDDYKVQLSRPRLGHGRGARKLVEALALCEALADRMFSFGKPEAAEALQQAVAHIRTGIERRLGLKSRPVGDDVPFLDDEVVNARLTSAVDEAKRLLAPIEAQSISAAAWARFEEELVGDEASGGFFEG